MGINKTISFIDQPESCKLMVFEGFMDFLSLLSFKQNADPKSAVIVLNSTNLWRHAVPYLQDERFKEIELYLDHGSAGNVVTEHSQNIETSANIADMRDLYAGYDDLNAWWMGQRA